MKKSTPAAERPTDIKHGCLDCKDKDTAVTKEPCKSCQNFSNWVDKISK